MEWTRIEIHIRSLVHDTWDLERIAKLKESLHRVGIHGQSPVLDRMYELHKRSHMDSILDNDPSESPKIESEIQGIVNELKAKAAD